MVAIRPEWRGADTIPTEKSFPERYFQPERQALPKLNGSEAGAADDLVAENMNLLIRRISSAPIDEIDRVIGELQGIRDRLRNESERMNREIAGYVRLSHASMTTIHTIADSLAQWKGTPPDSGSRSVS